MARFYRTASATPVDYMYRMNVPLMSQVIAANDQYITEQLGQAAQLGSAAQTFPYLTHDANRAKAITDQYTTQVNNIAQAIRKDPANWRNQLGNIETLRSSLTNNYRTGEISKTSDNYNKIKSTFDYIDKAVESFNKDGKGIDANTASIYKQHFLKNFKGTNYNPATGKYDSVSVFNPMYNMDIRKILSDEMDKMKADKTSFKVDEVTGNQMYFNTKKNAWEGITKERILNVAMGRLNDPAVMNYLKERSNVGIISGAFEDGKLINPFTANAVPLSANEQAALNQRKRQIESTKDPKKRQMMMDQFEKQEEEMRGRTSIGWNPKSYLSPILRGITDQFSYGQTETENTLRNNSAWNTMYTQGQLNARQNKELAQSMTIAKMLEDGRNDRHAKDLEFDYYKHDNSNETGKDGEGKTKNTFGFPMETGVSRMSNLPFVNWMTTASNSESVPVLSNQGLAADIDNIKSEETGLKDQLKAIDAALKVLPEGIAKQKRLMERERVNQLLVEKADDLKFRRTVYGNATLAAITNSSSSMDATRGDKPLEPNEVALYRAFEEDRDGKMLLQQIKGEGAKIFSGETGPYSNRVSRWLDNLTEYNTEQGRKVNELRNKYDDYLKVKKKVDDRRQTYLQNLRYNAIDTDMALLSKKDSDFIGNLIASNPQGLKMFDGGGNPSDKIVLDGKGISWFNHTGDNIPMSFNNGELGKYIEENGVGVKVEGVGNTTKIGTGNALVKLRFNDPTGQIPSSPFYLEVTPELQKSIGTRLAKDKNEDVKSIGTGLLDGEANNIRRQLINPSTQRTVGTLDKFEPTTSTVYVNVGNKKVPLIVSKYANSDGSDNLYVTYKDENGNEVPLPLGDNGWFKNGQELINALKK